MGILREDAIKRAVAEGVIHIAPYTEDSVKVNSVDVHLGGYYWLQDTSNNEPYDMGNEAQLMGRWTHCYSASFREPVYRGFGTQADPEHESHFRMGRVAIPPHTVVLCHTVEEIGAWDRYVPKLRTRSTFGRNGMIAVGGAGLGDVGFVGRWTFPIFNPTAHYLYIPAGMRIAQIYFETAEGTGVEYGDIGNYGVQGKDRTIAPWNPLDMVPKNSMSNLDKDIGGYAAYEMNPAWQHAESMQALEERRKGMGLGTPNLVT